MTSEFAIDPQARRRLEKLVDSHGLSPAASGALGRLLETLAGDPRAPTTIREPARAVDLHLADSLAGLEVDQLRRSRSLADLGSGAGFPGLPLAAALPGARISLIESASRKAEFLRRAIAAAGIPNAEVLALRAESWSEGRCRQDSVLARALAPLAVVVEYGAPLLREGGVLVAWKGRREPEQERAADRAGAIVGLELAEVRRVGPFAGAQHRHLYVYLKVRATPERFPRRPGIARKRPL